MTTTALPTASDQGCETPSEQQNWPAKVRLAILTNIVAPYRVPIYEYLSRFFDVRVFIAGAEADRAHWTPHSEASYRFSLWRSWGITVQRTIRRGRQVYSQRFFHFTPGYAWDLLRTRPSAVLSTEFGFRTLVALIYGLLFTTPVWVWWGGTEQTEHRAGRLRRIWRFAATRLARRWISYGKSSTNYLLRIGVRRERILEIQNCVEERLFLHPAQPLLELRPKPVILSVGRLVALKGTAQLIRAASRLQREGLQFSLLIVGDGPERESLQGLSTGLGLRDTQFHPAVPVTLMPSLYRSADLLVFPSLGDVWGLCVNEALWSGVPVLCSVYAGCAKELLDTELLFDPLNDEEFARALRRVLAKLPFKPDVSRLKPCLQVSEMIAADLRRVLKK